MKERLARLPAIIPGDSNSYSSQFEDEFFFDQSNKMENGLDTCLEINKAVQLPAIDHPQHIFYLQTMNNRREKTKNGKHKQTSDKDKSKRRKHGGIREKCNCMCQIEAKTKWWSKKLVHNNLPKCPERIKPLETKRINNMGKKKVRFLPAIARNENEQAKHEEKINHIDLDRINEMGKRVEEIGRLDINKDSEEEGRVNPQEANSNGKHITTKVLSVVVPC